MSEDSTLDKVLIRKYNPQYGISVILWGRGSSYPGEAKWHNDTSHTRCGIFPVPYSQATEYFGFKAEERLGAVIHWFRNQGIHLWWESDESKQFYWKPITTLEQAGKLLKKDAD